MSPIREFTSEKGQNTYILEIQLCDRKLANEYAHTGSFSGCSSSLNIVSPVHMHTEDLEKLEWATNIQLIR